MNDISSFQGFIVHAYPDLRRDRLYCVGRLSDGRSFAAIEETWRPSIHIFESDRERVFSLLSALKFEEIRTNLQAFSGVERLCCLSFSRYGDRAKAAVLLEEAAIQSPDAGIKPADLFLIERYIHGPACIRGRALPGRRVDMVIREPEFTAPEQDAAVPLRVASIDIETDVKSGLIRAVGIAWTDGLASKIADNGNGGDSGKTKNEPAIIGLVRVLSSGENNSRMGLSQNSVSFAQALAVFRPTDCKTEVLQQAQMENIFFHATEHSLLSAFIEDIHRIDPDVLTGWNFLDFDFPRLTERCEFLGLPFIVGRSPDQAKFFPGEAPGSSGAWRWRRRSAAAIVPGRQVLDSLRIVRAGTWGGAGGLRGAPGGDSFGGGSSGDGGSGGDENASDFTLETVARTVLGEGKIVHSSGEEKIAELDRLYTGDPRRFGEYCLRDAELVPRILAKTGLFRLTLERAALTGVSLDKAWTSVVSFERVYGTELRRKGIAPPVPDPNADVSGAAGGTVLDPLPGLFNNVAVFDFRSLYPSIMRTFNIDPIAHARTSTEENQIIAPNGAAFSRVPGLLPSLITEYFAARKIALDSGDSIAAQVYKILMNSFYGVLGTGACRYGRSKLAGSITSFARKWLLFSRDWFTEQGFRVLYGDTDSLFVETGFGDGAAYEDFAERCGGRAKELNRRLAEKIRAEYDLESFIELRFEKAYRRFLIPPLRNFHGAPGGGAAENRGRAKGYSGYLIHSANETGKGETTVEVKGMEAVRSDSTPLARRMQLELLELVFSGGSEEQFREKVRKALEALRDGKLDSELVYRKRLVRYPETYTASTPPQVKAARALGWKKRRGTVEYIWTVNGPEPTVLPHGKLDYDHYADSQIFPVARSIASAAGWDDSVFTHPKGRRAAADDCTGGQMELGFK